MRQHKTRTLLVPPRQQVNSKYETRTLLVPPKQQVNSESQTSIPKSEKPPRRYVIWTVTGLLLISCPFIGYQLGEYLFPDSEKANSEQSNDAATYDTVVADSSTEETDLSTTEDTKEQTTEMNKDTQSQASKPVPAKTNTTPTNQSSTSTTNPSTTTTQPSQNKKSGNGHKKTNKSATSSAPAWQPLKIYNAGDQVTYRGQTYEATKTNFMSAPSRESDSWKLVTS